MGGQTRQAHRCWGLTKNRCDCKDTSNTAADSTLSHGATFGASQTLNSWELDDPGVGAEIEN